MKDAFYDKILAPMLKALCDLAEQAGISLICYCEYREGLATASITETREQDCSATAELIMHAAHVQDFDSLAKRCLKHPEIVEKSDFLKKLKEGD